MITASFPTRHTSAGPSVGTWQRDLAEAYSRPQDLLEALGLDPALLTAAAQGAHARFRLRVPRSFVARMRRGDPADPLLRQVLPLGVELDPAAGFGPDPLTETAAERVPGLLQKYRGRALLMTTGACAVHCRYCFRREFPYGDHVSSAGLASALATLAADPSIDEVILSGGDPLSLSDARLREITDALARIPHLRRLRVHTRQPIVLPSRVDAGLLAWLAGLPWPRVMVVHANHPAEIDAEVEASLERLRGAGVQLLNQSVLLRGVNDSIETLASLSVRLFEAGVLPYYLHLLDRVSGSAHFEVTQARALELAQALAARLPGYLVPRLVREIPGALSKVALTPRP